MLLVVAAHPQPDSAPYLRTMEQRKHPLPKHGVRPFSPCHFRHPLSVLRPTPPFHKLLRPLPTQPQHQLTLSLLVTALPVAHPDLRSHPAYLRILASPPHSFDHPPPTLRVPPPPQSDFRQALAVS